ncbi:MAG: hypothetical protein EOO91_16295 [Pedobacter sp.]|nr:MAG: hypothetical protein EOO91_16295 [Pedobacter sp.]
MTTRFIVYLIIVLVVFLSGAWKFKKLSPAFKVLCLFMGITFISEVLSRVLIAKSQSSMPLYHIYSPIQYICFAIAFYYVFSNQTLKKLMVFSIPCMLIIGALNTIFLQSLNRFPTNFLILMLSIFILCSLLLFKQLFEKDEQELKKSIIYFNGTLLVYSAVVLLNLGLTNYFIKHQIDNKISRDIIYYITLLFYGTIGVTFKLDRSK